MKTPFHAFLVVVMGCSLLVSSAAMAVDARVRPEGIATGAYLPGDVAYRPSGAFWAVTKFQTPDFRNVSVHDPSVIKAGDTWYVFGSHLAAAKSTDLMNWDLVADVVYAGNPLFENVVTELQDIFQWSGATDLWANDVVQLKDGRFCMYPNLSRLDSPRASLGLAIADDIEGPYRYQGIFLQSGMWDQISEDGVNIYDPTFHPNTVDPHTFFDQEGTLWMVYGSYSGGIFILEMNPETCLPQPGQGYGKHLMGGNHSRIEGPFILYSPQTAYYYLFVTFGGLDANGGYNMRVARSLDPDGPYFDALGNDMADVKADPFLPLFDDASIEPFAQKLMGNFQFLGDAGDPATAKGYVSPGHNSVFHDESTGRYYLIFHTRFPGYGEFHQVRVHEMFINSDGWPVVAPSRYVPYRQEVYPFDSKAGRTRKIETISRSEAVGNYQLINHGKDISAAIRQSQSVTLQDDGTIGGAYNGTWRKSYGDRISIELDDIGLFNGVLSHGWNESLQEFVVTFTAMSAEGVSIWGSK